jgi:hypothetical protein
VSERARLGRAVDALAGEFGLLTLDADRRPSAEVNAAVGRVQFCFLAVDRLLHAVVADEDVYGIRAVWEAVAAAQDQMRRARQAVDVARSACIDAGHLRAAVAETVGQAKALRAAAREERRRKK